MIALLLLAVVVLILLNAFFVAAEFALVRSRKAHLQTDADAGKRGAATAVSMMDDLSRYLSAAQVGITLTSLGLGFLGEPAIGSLLEDLFGEEVPHWISTTVSITLAYLITTSLHITFGEQVPKIYAIQKAEVVARWCARPLLLFTRIFHPFISALNAASNGILRLLGVRTSGQLDDGETPEELRVLIQESLTGGKLDPNEAGMLTGVFHLHEQQARQVMTPAPGRDHGGHVARTSRPRCAAASRPATRGSSSPRTRTATASRASCTPTSSRSCCWPTARSASIEGLVREVPIVPETKPLDDLLADLQRQRSSLAVVIDEYGRTAGIVTVEDIIEEVVGEIDDETDPQGGEVRRLANGDWFVRGHVAITDLIDYGLELPVDSDAYNSVGGFVFGELGRLPKRGDTVTHNGYSIRVESVRENRIEAVRIRERHVPRSDTNGQS